MASTTWSRSNFIFAALLLLSTVAGRVDAQIPLDLPAQPLGTSITAVGTLGHVNVMFDPSVVDGLQAPALKAELNADDALGKLLAGTKLHAVRVDANTIRVTAEPAAKQTQTSAMSEGGASYSTANVRLAEAAAASEIAGDERERETPEAALGKKRESKRGDHSITLEEVLVTGSHIRGAQESSPAITLTQDEMLLQGQTNLGEAMRALPQSFGGGQNPGIGIGAGNGSNISNGNFTSGSSANLRGLGPDATLTLVDGRRLPYNGGFQAVDVSSIPLNAVERVDVLLDGASAIYGSDAVAGVVNVILKHDYRGLALTAGYGAPPAGGDSQIQYTAVGGTTWATGGFIATGSMERNTPLNSYQRDYTAYMPNPNYLFPSITQKNALLSGHESLADGLELSADSFYSDRKSTQLNNYSSLYSLTHVDNETYWLSPTLLADLPRDWKASLNGSIGHDGAQYDNILAFTGSALHILLSDLNFMGSLEADADGPVFELPAGTIRASIGVGYRRETYTNTFDRTGLSQRTFGSRGTRYAFNEVELPLVAPDQKVPAISRLSINGALRYEDYNDFGRVVTPKVGVVWAPIPDMILKFSWGRSFKAPTLKQEFGITQVSLEDAANHGLAGGPPNATDLLLYGGNIHLNPEHANTWSSGIDFHPQWSPGLTLTTDYFHVKYTGRVLQPIPDITTALSNSANAAAITYFPTPAQQLQAINQAASGQFINSTGSPYDPNSVIAILNDLYSNVIQQEVAGVDFSASYRAPALGGEIAETVSGSWIEGHQQNTETSPRFSTIGTLYNPPHFRARAGVRWIRSGLTLSSYLNYIGGVIDTQLTPSVVGGGETTVDLGLDYRVSAASAIGDAEVNVTMQNIFDRRPPFLDPIPNYQPSYDSTNYSAIGRALMLTVTKRFAW